MTALGTYLFHGAFFLLAAAVGMSMAMRDETKVWVAVGESFEGREDQILSHQAARLLWKALPDLDFTVDSVEPEYWGDQLLFTRLEARLELSQGRRGTTRINRPLWLGWSTFLRLSGFGFAPRYEILDRNGKVLDSAFVKLNVFPPGQRDSFVAGDYPHRVYLKVFPDAVIEDGAVANRSLNLERPAFDVQMIRGKLDLGRDVILLGESFEFEGLALRFPEIAYWGEFTIIRDPGMPVLFIAFAVALFGLIIKLRGGRAEVVWTPGPPGQHGRLEGWGDIEPPSEEHSS